MRRSSRWSSAVAGELLEAPGVLRNPVPVQALYDADAANAATLRNLLQRAGYEGSMRCAARAKAAKARPKPCSGSCVGASARYRIGPSVALPARPPNSLVARPTSSEPYFGNLTSSRRD
jgi:hypothetical protein